MRARHGLLILLGLGCQAQRQAGPSLTPPPWKSAGVTAYARGAQALIVDNGQERWIDAGQAERDGYTLIDLSDDFTPVLFADHPGQPNAYRSTFVGLANDRVDSDGQPLQAGSENHLELYGIFPSFSVLSRRFAGQAGRTCLDSASQAVFDPKAEQKKPTGKVTAETWKVLARRLGCEGLLAASAGHKPGRLDRPLLLALRRFQLKHMLYEGAQVRGDTRETLGRDLLENNHRALLRTLRERVVAAAGIIEDGSGSKRALGPAANLADDYTAVAARALGVDTPAGAEAFLRRRPPGGFGRLLAAVKLPPRPAHYDPAMQLKLVIDRGDVYYDPPFDETGKPVRQPRKKYPTLALVGELGGKELTLVRWRTTIGGWRLEQASDGYEYFRYKGSDVGPRVMRQITASPVWLAPPATPVRSLVKWKTVNGGSQRVVDYSELGPGYLSAYGLVAGYLVIPGKNGRPDRDNGIRAHGSAEYLSMYSADGFSHGCHRLPNHLAIRLYSYLLRRRPVRIQGQLEGVASRQFLHNDRVYEIRIHSRGYGYELDPPLPVEVRAGTIRGERKEPFVGYLPQPGVKYPGPPPLVPGATPEQLASEP